MPITAADHEPMRQAIEASREAVAEGNMPFGATLVSPEGSLLWTARNNQITRGDCTTPNATPNASKLAPRASHGPK